VNTRCLNRVAALPMENSACLGTLGCKTAVFLFTRASTEKAGCQLKATLNLARPLAHNNPLQRSGNDKVLGRGRGRALLEQVTSARVLNCWRAAAERGR
jgi:hypothetical protein